MTNEQTDAQKAAAMDAKAINDTLARVDALLKQATRLRDDGARALVLDQMDRELLRKYTVDDVELLAEDFKQKFRTAQERRLLAEAADHEEESARAVAALRRELEARITRSRTLSTAVKDDAQATVDLLATAEADRWMERRSMADVLARYQELGEADTRGRAWARAVEDAWARQAPIGVPGADAAEMQTTVNAAIRARQDARVSAEHRAQLAEITRLGEELTRVKATQRPRDHKLAGQMISNALQRPDSTTPRPRAVAEAPETLAAATRTTRAALAG